MTSTTNRDLGHGVRVMSGDGGGIVVLSADFDLGWRPRAGGNLGTAIMWEDSSFEVVDREPWRRGARWTLAPWAGEDVMRVVLSLDDASVNAAAQAARTAARAAELRPWLWLLSPFLGFAAASWQRRWRDDWGYPALLATWLSATLEIVVGAACLIEFIVAMIGDASLFPWMPRPLIYLGLVFFVEGLVRLMQVFSDAEPVGSIFGFLIALLEHREPPAPEPIPVPEVQTYDEDEGSLELLSPILRRDWEMPGLLSYRGGVFALESAGRRGESWVYEFCRVERSADGRDARLRLLPPRQPMGAPARDDSRGMVQMVLISIACTLAPRRFQARWAQELGVREIWFTVMGASAELFGGLTNLGATQGGPTLIVLLNLFFVGEAMARLASVVLRGEGLGSVFGLPLALILERYLPEHQSLSNEL